MDVPEEFSSLRQAPTIALGGPLSVERGASVLAKTSIRNRAGHIRLSFKAGAQPCGLELRPTDNAAPLFAIQYGGANDKPSVTIGDKVISLSPDAKGISTLDLWMDGSVIEVFFDSKEALTARNFTPSPGEIQLAWTGSAEALKSVGVSGVKAISDDRLTS
jgi:hypothetical protein